MINDKLSVMRNRIVLTLFLIHTLFFTTINAQNTFRITYDIDLQDIVGGLTQGTNGNYIISGLNMNLIPYGSITEIDQTGAVNWSKSYSDGILPTSFTDIKVTSSGGYIAPGSGNSHLMLIETDNAGTVSWAKEYDKSSASSESASRLKELSTGGYIVAGTVTGFNTGTVTLDSANFYAVKTDATGNLVWDKVYTMNESFDNDHYLNDVEEVSGGYVFVGSTSESGTDENTDAVIFKVDANTGNIIWEHRFGGAGSTQTLHSASLLSSGEVLVSGADGDNLILMVFDANGIQTWSQSYSSSTLFGADVPEGFDAFETSDGNYACAGMYVEANLPPVIGNFLIKVNSTSGAIIFQKFFAGNGLSTLLPRGIQTSDGGYNVVMTSQEFTGFEYYMVKTDANGTTLNPACQPSDIGLANTGYSPSFTAFTPGNYSGTSVSSFVPVVTNLTPTIVDACCTVQDPTTATASPSTICSGASSTITASGSASGAIYNVYDASTGGNLLGSTPLSVSPSSTTTYYVEAESSIGCTSINRIPVTVIVVTAPTVTVSPASSTICQGESVSLTANASGGSGSGYTYQWSTTETSSTINPTPASSTTYTVTTTDGAGCTSSSASSTITVNSPPVASISGGTTTCDNEQIILTASGGDSYSWNTGETTPSITVMPSSTFTYTVTVGLTGCTVSDQASQTVTVNSSPTASISGLSSICSGDTDTLTASGGNTYSWSTGETSPTIFVNPLSNTTFSLIAFSSNGCSDTIQQTVTVNSLPTVVANSSSSSVCDGQSVTLTGAGANTYTWDNGVSDGVAFTPTSTTTYTVTGTDGNGCQNTAQTTVLVNPLPTVVANASQTTACSGDMVTLTGSGANTYTWDNGVTDGTPFAVTGTTTYTVTGTDGNGCQNTDQITVTVNSLPTVVANASQTTACSGDQVTLTGSGANTYTWDNGVTDGVSFATSNTTTYTVTGTDGNGCQNTDQITVTVNSLPTVIASASPSNIICEGDQVTLTGSGTATSYSWDNGVSDGVAFTPSSTTTYTVTGVDANGCSNTDQITVTVNPLPTVVANTSPSTTVCSGSSIVLTGSGATTYSWDNGVTDGVSFVPASTTIYTVTGTDGNGCQNTDTVTINVVAPPVATINGSINGSTTSCSNEMTTLTVTPSGGTYLWSTGETTQSINVMPGSATAYTVTVTIGSCSDMTDYTVNVNTAPSGSINGVGNGIICSGSNDTITASGGVAYSWSTGETTNSIVVSTQTNTSYTVVVSDANNCSDTLIYNLNVNPLPSISVSGTDTICNGSSSSLAANGGVSYIWNTNETTQTITVAPTFNTNYSVIGTDANGCSDTAQYTVVVLSPPSAGITGDSTTCPGQSVTLTAAGGNSYVWSTGETTPVINVAPGSTNSYSVIAYVGSCADTAQYTVNVVPPPVVELGADTSIIIGQSFTLNATGASQYSWIPPNEGIAPSELNSSNPTVTPEESFTYCVVGEQNGCVDTACINVEVVIDCGEVFVPNAFSPNNDQVNDCLKVYSNCLESIVFRIYSRWGEVVFETNQIDDCWDGTYKGQLLNTGTYAFVLEYSLIDGTQSVLKGNVSLMK